MIKQALDSWYAYRFVRLLNMKWEDTPAFKNGVIDKTGKRIGSNVLTPSQAEAYTPFERLVYNIKRTIALVPGGKTRLGSIAASMWLLKECFIMDYESQDSILREAISEEFLTEVRSDEFGVDVDTFETVKLGRNAKFTGLTSRPGLYGEEIGLWSDNGRTIAALKI